MTKNCRRVIAIAAGFLGTAVCALPQAYTISAKPGVVNYIEGGAYLNGRPISDKATRATFLGPNDTVSTDSGKIEILLTPGVFLRLGENSAMRMISPSLTNTQLEVTRGEAMIEVDQLEKDNHLEVIDHGGSITIEKPGLYRLLADNPPSAAVLEGKAEVAFGERKIDLGKDHETVIGDALKAEKFDPKKPDELYAWSNVRSEYEAAASYQTAKTASASSYGGGWWGYGYSGGFGPGWYFNNGFDSWAWLPGSGAFYSPFGFGFYGPSVVGYAPIITRPVYSGGTYRNGQWNQNRAHWAKNGTNAAVPVSPVHPPAASGFTASPWANRVARQQAVRSFAASGFATGSGTRVPAGHAAAAWSGASHGNWAAAAAARASAGGGSGFRGAATNGGGGFHGGGGAGGGGFHGGGAGGGGGGGVAHK